MQLLRGPSIGAQDGVIEWFDAGPVEVAQNELTSGPKCARELGDRCADRGWLMVNGGEPGEDSAEGAIRFVDAVDALKLEPDAGVRRPRVVDERRHEVDSIRVEPEARQIVRPLPWTAAGIQHTAAHALGPGVDQLSIGWVHHGHVAQEIRVLGCPC